MAFDELLETLDLEESTKRVLIAAHNHELANAEISAEERIAEKNLVIEDLQKRIDELQAERANDAAKASRGRVYEPPVIKVVKYG